MNQVQPEFIQNLFMQGKTYSDVKIKLEELFPNQKGFSVISIKRFCRKHGISPRLNQDIVNTLVSQAVDEVGPTYGRKMMTGLIRYQYGISVGQNRIGVALSTVNPRNHQQRRNCTARRINPVPYRADYFGHKVHFDQNEKLVMYGVTHVVAIDGHSCFVVGAYTMPIKNNALIYQEVYRTAVLTHGMFDQIRVDGGREFYLMLGMQEIFKDLRTNHVIQPYRQTQSRQNLPIERFWPEVNARVNYPIKHILVEMDNNQIIDMEDDIIKYCVSETTCHVAYYGLRQVVTSWNMHPIAGRGVPATIRQQTNNLPNVTNTDLPEGNEARVLYERTYNGRLTEESPFGFDPLTGNDGLMTERRNRFFRAFNIAQIFGDVVNGRSASFKNAVLYYITVTQRLAQQS